MVVIHGNHLIHEYNITAVNTNTEIWLNILTLAAVQSISPVSLLYYHLVLETV
jgi:hypothetical protein